MVATKQDIGLIGEEYIEGDRLQLTVDVDTPDGSAKDLSGVPVEFAILDDYGEPEELSETSSGVTVTKPSPTNGEIKVTLDADVTDGLAGAWVYEVRVDDAVTVTRGDLYISERGNA